MDKMTPERVIERLSEHRDRHAEQVDELRAMHQGGSWLAMEDALASEYEAMAETVRTLQGERDRLRALIGEIADELIAVQAKACDADTDLWLEGPVAKLRAALHPEPLGEGGGL